MSVSLNKEMNLVVQIKLIVKGSDKPLEGDEYKVRLYDKDLLIDDYLGESGVEDGLASFIITKEQFSSPLNLEEKPDFFFAVFRDGKEIFRSKTMMDLEISDLQNFVMKEGEVIDLGTFLVDTDIN